MDNNENNSIFESALNTIKRAAKYKPKCVAIIGPTGPTGATGPIGPTGDNGETPTITIGTVTTGLPGSSAMASITGTIPNFVLNLTIPQGPTGPTGSDS